MLIHFTSAERRVILVIAIVVAASAAVGGAVKQFPFLKKMTNLLESDELYPKVNINRASYQQLLDLPYVGAKTAQAIIDYRQQSGRFSSVDELTNVKGVSFGNLSKIKPYLIAK